MKVRNYYSPDKQIYLDLCLTPFYKDGKLLGYQYYETGWWGIENFNQELKNGYIEIINQIEPNQKIKKLKFI